ncbi:putative protein phosphatase 2C 28 [Platanthera zijinensis]|uniref:protein-serine/threonine phosphatase n=1 Tax=Platanthera zijinensis TaxID=2320716 RepID=A0AAP0AWF7_9ASPA
MVALKCLHVCCRWKLFQKYSITGSDDAFGRSRDGLLWCKDFGHHVNGEFSMASVQANLLIEDLSQIESGSLSLSDSGPFGSFVGVYDGHGGQEAAQYIANHLFGHIKRLTAEQQSMSLDVLRNAIHDTETGFLSLVSEQWLLNPRLASAGSCCLVGIVCDGTIYVASLGDSRAVLGRLVRATGEVLPLQLSAEHNVSIESVRQEVRSSHSDDPEIVVQKHNVWRVKGLIQISRSIGDAFLKKAEFNRKPLMPRFRLRDTFSKPILSSEPSISVQKVHPDDKFIIFASDGLWEQLSNQDAVNFIQNHPRKLTIFKLVQFLFLGELREGFCSLNSIEGSNKIQLLAELWQGIARRLAMAAMQKAAKKREMRTSDLMRISLEVRRHFHDDITVIVLFLDSSLVGEISSSKGPTVSLRAGSMTQLPANSLAPLMDR